MKLISPFENKLEGFNSFLIKRSYSQLVIKQYLRALKQFLNYCDLNSVRWTDNDHLKVVIAEYLNTLPLTITKTQIQAALHAYYYHLSGTLYFKKIYLSDFRQDTIIEKEIERFKNYLLNIAKLSENTRITHCNTVRLFLYCSFSNKHEHFSPKNINREHVKIYFDEHLNHVKTSTKKTIIVRIRSYLKFLEYSDNLNFDEILKLPMTPPVWKKASIPKYLTETEMAALLATYNQSKPVGIRDYAIICCLKDLGLRCSEVARLTLDDFNWVQGTITIQQTKTYTKRTLPLHIETGQAIEKYLVNSRPLVKERTLFLRFKNEIGQPMGTSQIRGTVRRAAVKAGFKHFKGTHMLRHTAAKDMLNNNVNLKTIADILGHNSIETTSIYTKVNFSELQNVAGLWPWRKN